MAEEQAPNFQGMPQSARTKKYNKLYDTLTSQTVGDRSFADMYGALQEAEVGAYKEKTGWPYIFTGASRKSSAFGPLQITYSTALDYFYPGDSETEKRDNMKAGIFKEGYTQLPNDVKGYIKGFIEQGINKRNNKGGVYGRFGVGDISAEDHKKHYPFLAAVHVNEKKKIADVDTVPSFVNAHFGDIQEDDPQKQKKQKQLANLQTKVDETLGVTVTPDTGEEGGFSEPKPLTTAPVEPETQAQTDEAFTLDYEGELPDIGDDVPRPDLPATDVAPDTTDAIPPAMVDIPEDKNIFERAYDYMFGDKDTPEEAQQREQTRQRLLQSLEMNEGGVATAIQESRDIETGADTRTKQEMLSDQMAGLGVVGKTAVESVPGVGEAIVAKEVAEDASSGDYLSAGIGTAALGMGFLPAGDILNKPLRAAAKKFRKQDNESAKKLMIDEAAAETWKETNKLPESQRQKRVPEVQQAATDLSEGKITSKEYRRAVSANQPIQPITKENFPDMPTKTEIVGALKATDPRKVDTGIVGLNKSIPDGTRVGSRLDIPSYDNYDKWIVSLHDGTVRNGKAIGYGQTAVLKDVEFISSAKGGLGIAKGKAKTTIARIHGDYQNAEPENVFEAAKQLIDDPEWTQVGMNPFRHSYFYDKATGNPVTKADEVIQVGPLVLAKGVKKPTLSEMKELVGGTKVVKDGKVTYKGAVRTEDGKIRTFNEGGMAMERQMEMFEDGGLMDEGGTVDPVSGNDVPPGSTQEEVRDDIPAQLSEGEFVFPADVVRYIGLEKLMKMRQEAKMGLQRMEAMGQMGNSEEAVLPDDIPFDLDDLDMEDEPMEFQQGGLVPNPYGVYQQPSQFATYGQQQYQAPQIPTAPMAPQAPLQTGFQPVTTPVQTTAVPTFEQIMPTTTGKYDELREYVNEETGQTMTIPFVDGKPIYPIPQGFVPKPTEQVEAVVPETTTVPTTSVVERDTGEADERRRQKEEEMYGPGGGRLGIAGDIYGVSFDAPGFMSSLGIAGGLLSGKGLPEGATAVIKRGDDTFRLTADEYNNLKKVIKSEGANSPAAAETLDTLRAEAKSKQVIRNAEAMAKQAQEQLKDDEDRGFGRTEYKINEYDSAGNVKNVATVTKKVAQEIASGVDIEAAAFDFDLPAPPPAPPPAPKPTPRDDSNDNRPSGGSGRTESAGADWSASQQSVSTPSSSGDPRGYSMRAEGGLMQKEKPKPKKMKQGGMASKK